ncbi:MAG: type II toxin-antitoxin system YafQ family toxin [Verrucomicrobia bacterium]|nr:type II toxin-antitoxin system YafQ family toxin [Verrucomicrobiota bacterium]
MRRRSRPWRTQGPVEIWSGLIRLKSFLRAGRHEEHLSDQPIQEGFPGAPLESRHHDHPLSGKWTRSRDCHVEPDWVLIYRIDGDSLYLERTGSHSDLFR